MGKAEVGQSRSRSAATYRACWRSLAAFGLIVFLAGCVPAPPFAVGNLISARSPTPDSTEGSGTVDAAGGEVQGADGVKITVPPRALSAATTLRIARDGTGAPELGGLQLITPIYAITPHGALFAEPARVNIPFSAADVAPGLRPVLLKAEPGGHWQVLASDGVGGAVSSADTPDLSYFAVGTCFTTNNEKVGPDPQRYCPAAHQLNVTLLDGSGAPLPAPPSSPGLSPAALIVTTPTTLSYRLNWTRPANARHTDRVSMRIHGAGLAPSQQPLIDLVSDADFTRSFATVIDPARVPGASAPDGALIRFAASVSYTVDAFHPGCACFRPARWSHETAIAVRVHYSGSQPGIAQQPQNQSVLEGQSAHFSVGTSGSDLSYLWKRVLANQVEVDAPLPNTSVTYALPAAALAMNGDQFYVQVCAGLGTAQAQCINSNAASLSVAGSAVAPVFTVQPRSPEAIAGTTTGLYAVAVGQPAPTITWWRLAGPFGSGRREPVCTPTTGTGNITRAACNVVVTASLSNIETYFATASNSISTNTDSNPIPLAGGYALGPTIYPHFEPSDRSVVEGATLSWTIPTRGAGALSYRWVSYPPGSNLPDAKVVCAGGVDPGQSSSATLVLVNVALACNGYRFQARVTNGIPPVAESRMALLTVNPAPLAPRVTTALADRAVLDGTQVSFNVGASGTPGTFSYEWTLEGQVLTNPVSGCATGSSTCTFAARSADSGKTVRVSVRNGQAPDAQSQATLTVMNSGAAASIAQQPLDVTMLAGGSARFSVGVAGTPTPSVLWQTRIGSQNWASAGVGTTFAVAPATLEMNGLRVRAIVSNTVDTPTGPEAHAVESRNAVLTLSSAETPGMAMLAGNRIVLSAGRAILVRSPP